MNKFAPERLGGRPYDNTPPTVTPGGNRPTSVWISSSSFEQWLSAPPRVLCVVMRREGQCRVMFSGKSRNKHTFLGPMAMALENSRAMWLRDVRPQKRHHARQAEQAGQDYGFGDLEVGEFKHTFFLSLSLPLGRFRQGMAARERAGRQAGDLCIKRFFFEENRFNLRF